MTEKLRIQAPVTVDLVVTITNGDLTANVTFSMAPGRYPTEQEMRDAVAGVPKLDQVPDGFRLATKREFWRNVCDERFGVQVALPGGQEYDA